LKLQIELANAVAFFERSKGELLHGLTAALQTDARAKDPNFVYKLLQAFQATSVDLQSLPAYRQLFEPQNNAEASSKKTVRRGQDLNLRSQRESDTLT
jgi:hypothetical protein